MNSAIAHEQTHFQLSDTLTVHAVKGSYIFIGSGLRLDMHAAHAFTVARAVGGRLLVRFAGSSQWHACTSAVIAPDVVHQLDASDGIALTAMIGPDSMDGRRLAWRTTLGNESPVPPHDDPLALYRWLLELHAMPTRRLLDPRIRRVLRLIRESPRVHLPVSDLASAVALSPSRLVHIFRAQTNTTIKRYSLWLRLAAAFMAMAHGSSLTDTAYAVGFADPAHLTRTYQRLLGLYPSYVIRQFGHADSFFVHPRHE